jgi:hypothetical protein
MNENEKVDTVFTFHPLKNFKKRIRTPKFLSDKLDYNYPKSDPNNAPPEVYMYIYLYMYIYMYIYVYKYE